MINFSLAYSHTCRAVDSYTLPSPRNGWHSKVFENFSVNFGQFQNESHPVFLQKKKVHLSFFSKVPIEGHWLEHLEALSLDHHSRRISWESSASKLPCLPLASPFHAWPGCAMTPRKNILSPEQSAFAQDTDWKAMLLFSRVPCSSYKSDPRDLRNQCTVLCPLQT